MRERNIVPIILILGLALYFPILATGTFILDDSDVLSIAEQLGSRSIFDIITGGNSTYFRPVLLLSHLLDLTIWGMRPGFMHLVNILIHITNALLVYLTVRLYYPQQNKKVSVFPVAASLLFLVHPINTESINWISGRSDPLASLFVLLGTYCVFKAIQNSRLWQIWLASCSLLLGSMTKEVAFFSFPAISLIVLAYKTKKTYLYSSPGWRWRLLAIIPLFIGGAVYLYLRSASFQIVDKGIAIVTDIESYQPSTLQSLQRVVTDFGYYIKKFFIPQPLSLAIDYVHPAYFWLGVITIILIAALLFYRNPLAAMLLLITLTIFPALLNALLHIAWTPYAERYLYLPGAFLCMALALPLPEKNRSLQRYRVILLVFMMCIFLPTTVQRNHLWANPLELTQYTHQQNPDNPKVWTMYAVMLANQKRYEDARIEFRKILVQHPDHLYALDSYASMEMYVNDPAAARQVLKRFFNRELEADRAILQLMLQCNQERLKNNPGKEARDEIRLELIATNLLIYEQQKNPEALLGAAEMAIDNNDNDAAETYLRRILNSKNLHPQTAMKATDLFNKFR